MATERYQFDNAPSVAFSPNDRDYWRKRHAAWMAAGNADPDAPQSDSYLNPVIHYATWNGGYTVCGQNALATRAITPRTGMTRPERVCAKCDFDSDGGRDLTPPVYFTDQGWISRNALGVDAR